MRHAREGRGSATVRPGRGRVAASLAVAVSLVLAACSAPQNGPRTQRANTAPPAASPSFDPVLSAGPWAFEGYSGRLITTPAYTIHTTDRSPLVVQRLPAFMELALAHYTSHLGDLPEPEDRMEVYVLATRSQWIALAYSLMGSRAEPFLSIRAGGFASGGRALLFDLGTRATLSVAAHEGWHQYTQRTFRDPLPIWLEEGIATYMEGYRWDPDRPDRPLFRPWANTERYDHLRRMHAEGRLTPLSRLLIDRPQDLLSPYTSDPALDYYAQVWALVHFLREGEHGRHRAALERLLRDAAHGRFARTIAADQGAAASRRLLTRRTGPDAFLVYFNDDLADADRAYRAFVERITRTGARNAISAGRSPLGE